jgi:hypothetical protein
MKMKASNRIKGIYLLWVSIHITLWLVSGNFFSKTTYEAKSFFPFHTNWSDLGFDNWKVYDISELLVYTLVPLVLYYSFRLIFGKEKNK